MEAAENAWRPLGELLVAKGLVLPDELELALTEQEETGRLLGAILVERGYVSGPALAVALAEQYGVELKTEGGFGTGLWAEIDRRHRRGRGHDDNVVQFEPVRLVSVEPVPDPDPLFEALELQNRALQDEIERLRAEFARLETTQIPETPEVPEIPEGPSSHLLFVPTASRYLMVERVGPPPAPGDELQLPDVREPYAVVKLGRSPYPGDSRPCAYLTALPG